MQYFKDYHYLLFKTLLQELIYFFFDLISFLIIYEKNEKSDIPYLLLHK